MVTGQRGTGRPRKRIMTHHDNLGADSRPLYARLHEEDWMRSGGGL